METPSNIAVNTNEQNSSSTDSVTIQIEPQPNTTRNLSPPSFPSNMRRNDSETVLPLLAHTDRRSGSDEEDNSDSSSSNQTVLPRILMQRNNQDRPWWRRSIFLEFIWFTAVNILLLIAILKHSGSFEEESSPTHHSHDDKDENVLSPWSCSTKGDRLRHWALIQIVVQSLMQFTNVSLQCKLPRSENEQLPSRRLHSIMTLYILSRFLNLVWFVWTLLGIIWTFESRDCSNQLGFLYGTCLVLSILHMIGFGLPIIVCCCSFPVGMAIWCCCPSWLSRGNQPKKATKKEIKKLTKSIKYKPEENNNENSELNIKSEDANCAICLAEYESGEEIRFLRCKHHFHSECIMQWLLQNKTCPMCKQAIDYDEEQEIKKKEANNSPQAQSQDTDDEEDDGLGLGNHRAIFSATPVATPGLATFMV